MNTQADILARLLRLFPVKKIKDNWEKKGNKDDLVADIAGKSSASSIYNFAEQNSGLTKQLICVRRNEKTPIKDLPDAVLSSAAWSCSDTKPSRAQYFYLVDLIYNVILQDPLEKTELRFKWPVKVVFEKNYLLIYITLMEQNVKTYYPDNRSAIVSSKDKDEDDIVREICRTLKIDFDDSAVDLNKGIKFLWDQDLFDAFNTKFKKSTSTSSEAMDKGKLLKRDNPKDYATLVSRPLLKTGFQFLKKSDNYPNHFVANPTFGEIWIPTYSETTNISENVIREILKHN
jgi:hypothetical protein